MEDKVEEPWMKCPICGGRLCWEGDEEAFTDEGESKITGVYHCDNCGAEVTITT